MKFWQKLSSALRNKKIIFGVLAVAVVFGVGLMPFHEAMAQGGADIGILDVVSNPVGIPLYGISYFINWASSKIFLLASSIVEMILDWNSKVIGQSVVVTGWSITLSFANLGFVLAIIVIAFATIFRMQSYAMKQVLWKLIVAALLVNFSLVIAGAFINIADTVTSIFQEKSNLTADKAGGIIAGRFNPQQMVSVDKEYCYWMASESGFVIYQVNKYLNPSIEIGGIKCFKDNVGEVGSLSSSVNYICTCTTIEGKEEKLKKAVQNFGKQNADYYAMTLSMLLGAVLILSGAFSLFAFSIMLLIRFITLAILLVLSPLVWLCWILPATQGLWQKWWNNFLRWTFFAPAVMFFMYFALKAHEGIFSVAGTDTAKAVNQEFLQPGVFEIISSYIILIGFMFGGLYVANSLSITGASTAMGFAKDAGKWAGGMVGRKGLQWGTSPLRAKWGKPGEEKSLADRISGWSAKSKLTKIPLLGAVPGLAARGIAKFSAAGGENLVNQTKAAANKRSLNENIAMLGYADAPNRQGILQHLQEKDLLDKVPNGIKYIDKKYKAEAVRFGQGVGYNNIEKSLGMNVEMKKAFDGGKMEDFLTEGKKFYSEFSEKDWTKPQYNEMYGSKPGHGTSQELHNARQQVFAQAVGEVNPGQLAKTMPKIKGANFDNYEDAVKKVINDMEKMAYEVDKTDSKKAEKIYVKAASIEDSFKEALGRRTLGIEWELPPEFAESAKPIESKEEKKV